ncbi:C40 family peptidase [Mariniphaga sediminis]|uniref:C40 family peptidase n=1 Tax=Mariniphaga sediminis TaxID=1628158 RepID=UPI0035683BC4
MDYGISGLSLIPVRKEPSEKSEMVTQVLFGEHFEIFEEMVGWCHVRLAWDGYEGWIDSKMITSVNVRTINKLEKRPYAVTGDIISLIPVNDEQNLVLVAGSTLPVWRPYLKEFSVDKDTYKSEGEVYYGVQKNPREVVIKQALKYFNAPYLWGGRSPFGIDCSGFTQIIYKMIGMRIPRDAGEQVKMGVALSFVDETEPGDLAFFDDEEGNIVHVGIIWQRNKIIHASGKVRIDNVDQFGIFNVDLKRYTHKMRVMKKIIGTNETD